MRERTRPPVHPGGILKRQYLEPLGLGISQAALALGVSRQTLPELWLNLQRNYDLWHAAQRSEA